MSAHLGSVKETESLPEKLNSLREYLVKSSKSAKLVNSSNSEYLDHYLSVAVNLFNQAPKSFLESASLEELSAITSTVDDFLSTFIDSKKPFLCQLKNSSEPVDNSEFTTILIASEHRRFLVDTIQEVLQEKELRYDVVLHPTLDFGKERAISLIYMQVEPIEDYSLARLLQSHIEESLSNIHLVTDDFDATLTKVEEQTRLLSKASRQIVEPTSAKDKVLKEITDFLPWLTREMFVFLGYREWQIEINTSSGNGETQTSPLSDRDLGLFRSANFNTKDTLLDIEANANILANSDRQFQYSRSFVNSPVHRKKRLDCFFLKIPQPKNTPGKIICLIGLLTTKAEKQQITDVPVIRRRLHTILEADAPLATSFANKELSAVANSLPKSEIFHTSLSELQNLMHTVLDAERSPGTKIFSSPDVARKFLSIMLSIPKSRYSATVQQRIVAHLEQKFGIKGQTRAITTSRSSSDKQLVFLHCPFSSDERQELSIGELEDEINELTLTWEDRFRRGLFSSNQGNSARRLFNFYQEAFPNQYKAITTPEDAVHDVDVLGTLSPRHTLEVALRAEPLNPNRYVLTLYKRGENLTLSTILPVLENIGFHIISETVTEVHSHGSLWAAIYNLKVETLDEIDLPPETISDTVIPGLKRLFKGEAENDQLNRLLVAPGIPLERIAILRALAHYLRQIGQYSSERSISEALTENPKVAKLLVDYFISKFNPSAFDRNLEKRERALRLAQESVLLELKNVERLLHDLVCRSLLNIINSTVRTNHFYDTSSLTIALKIECAKIAEMPLPRPKYEIFVNGPEFEGVHLRGGNVARGGLRWSERPEDYRTEVLGLMKTQMVKNSIIIPVGAKGGFVLKGRLEAQENLGKQVEHCYRNFIRSLLQLVDNRTAEGIYRPAEVIAFDGEDSYLVVAADKGTATFSDIANDIAVNEFDFWLGDAFASGGSNGYDHKKLAITAAGAFETTKR
ncbi:hypothetical protein BVY02_02605, partial [bacterium J17]